MPFDIQAYTLDLSMFNFGPQGKHVSKCAAFPPKYSHPQEDALLLLVPMKEQILLHPERKNNNFESCTNYYFSAAVHTDMEQLIIHVNKQDINVETAL